MENTTRKAAIELSPVELQRFFISHLNRIYCAKSQLVDKLPLLGSRANFVDLQQAVGETVDAVRLQIQRMNRIYILMDAFYQPESCIGLAGILDEAFQSIGRPGDDRIFATCRSCSICITLRALKPPRSRSCCV